MKSVCFFILGLICFSLFQEEAEIIAPPPSSPHVEVDARPVFESLDDLFAEVL